MFQYTWSWRNDESKDDIKWEKFSDKTMAELTTAYQIGRTRYSYADPDPRYGLLHFHLGGNVLAFYREENKTRPFRVKFEKVEQSHTIHSSKSITYSTEDLICGSVSLEDTGKGLSSRLNTLLDSPTNWNQSMLYREFETAVSGKSQETIEEELKQASTAEGHITAVKHYFKAQGKKFELWKDKLVIMNNSNLEYQFKVINPTHEHQSEFFSCMHVDRPVDKPKHEFSSTGKIPPNNYVTLEIGVVMNGIAFNRLIVIEILEESENQPTKTVQRLFVAINLECSGGNSESWKVDELDYSVDEKPIDGGANGQVFPASIRGFVCTAKSWKTDAKAELIEAEIANLRKMKHNHVISLLGEVEYPRRLAFMRKGVLNLRKLLRNPPPRLEYSWRLRMAKQLADGLVHLHSKGCTHRDIKPDNVVFIDEFAVIVDLGSEGVKGTKPYMAPEAFREEFDLKVDIFSFGLMLWELLEEESPRHGWDDSKLKYGLTPVMSESHPLPPQFKIQIQQLYKSCVHRNPQARPSAQEIFESLKSIHSEVVTSETSRLAGPKNN